MTVRGKTSSCSSSACRSSGGGVEEGVMRSIVVECEASVLKQPSTKALVKDYRIMYNKFLMFLLLVYLLK
jgi:hypothetical protein